MASTILGFDVQYMFSFNRTESGAGHATARTIPKSTESWDIRNELSWDRYQQRALEKSLQEDFPHEEIIRGNRAWQGFCDRTIRCPQNAQLVLLSGVPEIYFCARTWTSWNVAAFPRLSSLCPSSALVSWNTWVARARFSRKPIDWGWAGASEGEDQKGPSCGTRSWASVSWGLDHRWSWCRWPSVASSDKGVVLGGCAEDGRQLWTGW